MQTKICKKCLVEKESIFFYSFKNNHRLSTNCKECIRLKGKYASGYQKPIDLPNEIWKDIPRYENIYQVSSLGRVKSLERKSWNGQNWHITIERILKQSLLRDNYYFVGLSKNGKAKSKEIHVLVAMAFLGHVPCGFKIVVDHIDENPKNNNYKNLQLITNRENINRSLEKINNSSKYRGVSYDTRVKRFKASICIYHKKNVYLGYFVNEIDAHNTYQTALSNLDKYENDKQFRELVKKLNQI